MPLGRAVPIVIMALMALAAVGCATGAPPQAVDVPRPAEARVSDEGTARIPREVRIGAVDMVIQAVETDIRREEIAAAIAPMLANAPVCTRWPALWMEQTRHSSFVVRYDLMARDWGEGSTASAEALMTEFVELGFVTASASADARSVTYTLTEAGEQYLVGLIEPGRRPQFCAPAERRLVDIANLEWGRFPCGTLRVQFTHVADDWPSWARSESTRARLAASWPPLGEAARGSVSLSRTWYSRSALPPGYPNGALTSSCYDASRQQVVGNDLNLAARQIE
jgi:hypothetical protein